MNENPKMKRIECPCGGKYTPSTQMKRLHFETVRHREFLAGKSYLR